jgi:hypothetical protein
LFFEVVACAEQLPIGSAQITTGNVGEPITTFIYEPPTYGTVRADFRKGTVSESALSARRVGGQEWQGPVAGGVDLYGDSSVGHVECECERGRTRPAVPYYLIGRSAGGQFLERLKGFYPGEATRIIAGKPDSHLFPQRGQEFDYGFGGLPAELSNDEVIRRYLAAPLTFYLGTGDITTEHNFDASPEGMRQGPNRRARGWACFAAAEKPAKERGWAFSWRKVETPGIGHDAAFMFAAKEVEVAIFGVNKK